MLERHDPQSHSPVDPRKGRGNGKGMDHEVSNEKGHNQTDDPAASLWCLTSSRVTTEGYILKKEHGIFIRKC